MPTAAYVGKRRHLVWDPKTLNFHVLVRGLEPRSTEFSCAHAWFGTPDLITILVCSMIIIHACSMRALHAYDHNTCMYYNHNT